MEFMFNISIPCILADLYVLNHCHCHHNGQNKNNTLFVVVQNRKKRFSHIKPVHGMPGN